MSTAHDDTFDARNAHAKRFNDGWIRSARFARGAQTTQTAHDSSSVELVAAPSTRTLRRNASVPTETRVSAQLFLAALAARAFASRSSNALRWSGDIGLRFALGAELDAARFGGADFVAADLAAVPLAK